VLSSDAKGKAMTVNEDVTVLVNRIERLKRSSDAEQRRGNYDDTESLRNKANDAALQLCGLLRRLGIAGPREVTS
jgi:hypothetical protein